MRIIFLIIASFSQVASHAQNMYAVIDSRFANLPFGFVVLPENVVKVSDCVFKIDATRIFNNHTGEYDSSLEYKCAKSRFQFYKSKSKTFLQSAEICDPNIKLAKGLKVGLSKNEFKTIFKVPSSVKFDSASITDDEQFSQIKVYFRDGVIDLIEVISGFD